MKRRAFFVALGGLALPKATEAKDHTLELSDVIDILTEYQVRHPSSIFVIGKGYAYGITDNPQRIIATIINPEVDLPYMRYTMIHEMHHVKDMKEGGNRTEREIHDLAIPTYEALYGKLEFKVDNR